MNITIDNIAMHDSENRLANTRVYFFVKDECILDNLAKRKSRPYKVYAGLLPEVFRRLEMVPEEAHWSQKAGCSCGCSPGFILENSKGKDIFVDIVNR